MCGIIYDVAVLSAFSSFIFLACFLHCSTGVVSSWSSPAIPKLNLSAGETSLVTGLPGLGAATGPFIITLCLNTIGRKGTLYVLWIFFVISWVLLLVSKNMSVIYLARTISGVGFGAACSGLPIYVSEVAIVSEQLVFQLLTN